MAKRKDKKAERIRNIFNKANTASRIQWERINQKGFDFANDNQITEAERIDSLLQPVHKALFIESNPSPVKYAAKLLGLCDDAVRLPLVKIMDETKLKVKNSLVSAKLINE